MRGLAAACWVCTLAVAGCGAATRTHEGAGSGGSAGPAVTSRPRTPGPSVSTPADRCTAGQRRMGLPANGGRTCLVVGATLVIDLPAAPSQPWQPVSTSDASVLSCATDRSADGAITATCQAWRAGRAILHAATAPFAGDPHGPGQRDWRVTVDVHG